MKSSSRIVSFIVDVIIVLDSEWLATKLTSDLPSVKVITLPKSGGVSLLNDTERYREICTFLGRSKGLSKR